jgi:hypothetical protein
MKAWKKGAVIGGIWGLVSMPINLIWGCISEFLYFSDSVEPSSIFFKAVVQRFNCHASPVFYPSFPVVNSINISP